jgi:hypothetical protein
MSGSSHVACYRGGVRALLAMVGLVACAPSYDGTAFRCDAAHGCPTGQSCLAGRCRRAMPVAIACGSATCMPDEQCCVDVVNPPRCLPATETCPGDAALCDTRDDCAPVERCCNTDDGAACALACDSDHVACIVDADCPGDAPHCCPQPIVPWGECALLSC